MLRTRRPPNTPPFNHLQSDKYRPTMPKSYFCNVFANFWPILGSAVLLCPVEGRVVLSPKGPKIEKIQSRLKISTSLEIFNLD